MSNKELLITLGLDDSSYTKKINKANNLTKEYKKEIDKLSSSVGDMEKDIESLSSAYKSYGNILEIATLASKEHKKQMSSTTDEINKFKEKIESVNKEIEEEEKRVKKLTEGMEVGSKEYNKTTKELKALQAQKAKYVKELDAFTLKNIKANASYNESQASIQKITRQMMEMEKAINTVNKADGLTDLVKESEELKTSFDTLKAETLDFGSKIEDLANEQIYLSKQTEITNKIFLESKERMETAEKASIGFKEEINRLQKEINDLEDSLDNVDQNTELFAKTTDQIEQLRLAVTQQTTALDINNKEFEEASKIHGKANTSLNKFSKDMLDSGKKMETMIDDLSFMPLQKDIENLSKKTMKDLDNSINRSKKEFELFKLENKDLKDTFTMLGTESKMLSTILGNYESQLEIVNTELRESSTSYDRLKNEVDQLTMSYNEQLAIAKKLGEIDGAKNYDEARRLKDLIEEKTIELKKQEDATEKLNKKYETINDTIRKTKASLEDVGKSIDDAFNNIKFNYFVKETEELSDTVLKKLDSQLESTANEFKAFVRVNENYKDSMVGLKTELEYNEKNLKFMSTAQEKLTKITKEYSDEVRRIEDRLRKNNQTLDGYEKQLKSLAGSQRENTEEIDKLNKKIEKTNSTVDKNKELLEEAKKKFESNSSALQTLTGKIENTEDSITKLNNSMSKMRDTKMFKEVAEDVHKLSDDALKGLKQRVEECEEVYNDFLSTNKNVDESLELTHKKYILLSRTMDESAEYARLLEQEFLKSSTSSRELSEQIEKLNNKCRELEKIRANSQKGAKAYDDATEELKKQLALLDEKKAALTAEESRVERLSGEYKQVTTAIKNMGREASDSLDQMNKITEKLNLKEVEEDINKLAKETLTNFNNKLQSSSDAIKEIKLVSDGFEKTATGLGLKFEYLNDSMEVTRQKSNFLNKEFLEAKNVLRDLEDQQEKLNRKLIEFSQIDTSKATVGELQEAINKMEQTEAQLEVVNGKVVEQREYFNMLGQEIKETSTKSQELRLESERVADSIQKIRDSAAFTELKQDVNELANKSFQLLDTKLEKVTTELEQLETFNKSYGNTVEGLNAKIKLQTEQLNILNQKQRLNTTEIEKSTKAIKLKTQEQQKLIKQLKELGNAAGTQQVELLDGTVTTVKELREELTKVEKELKEQETRLKSLKGDYSSTAKEANRLGVEIKEASRASKELAIHSNSGVSKLDTSISALSGKMSKLESSYAMLQSKVMNFGRSKKDLATTTDYLNNKFKILDATLQAQKAKYDALKNEQRQFKELNRETANSIQKLQQELKNMNSSDAQFATKTAKLRELKNELRDGQNEVKEYNRSLDQLESELNQTATQINNVTREQNLLNTSFAASNIDRFANRLDRVGGALSQFGSSMMGMSVVIGGMGAAMIKTGSQFESAMSRTGAIFEATGDTFDRLSDTARHFGQTTVYSAHEAAEGLQYLGMAGYGVEDAIGALPQVLQLAIAGSMDLGRASDLATDSIAALGKTGQKALEFLPEYLNKMAKTSVKANYSIEQVMSSFLKAGGQINKMKISIDQAGAMLGILANRGMKAEQAGTALNAVLINLTQKSGQSAEAMEFLAKKVGHATDNLMFDAKGNIRDFEEAILDIGRAFQGLTEQEKITFENMLGGKTRAQALTNILTGMVDEAGNLTDEYKNLKQEISTAPEENFLQTMSESINDNLAGDFKELTSAISEMFIVIMEGISPNLRDFIQGITEKVVALTDKISQLSPEFLSAATAIGAILVVLPLVLNGLGQFMQNMAFLSRGVSEARRKLGEYKERTREAAREQEELAEEIQDTNQQLQNQDNRLEESTRELNRNERALEENSRAQQKRNNAQRNSRNAQRDNDDATRNGTNILNNNSGALNRNSDAANRNQSQLGNLGNAQGRLQRQTETSTSSNNKLGAMFGKVAGKITGLVNKVTAFISGLSATTVAITAAIAALVAIATAVGENRDALGWLIEEWGWLGEKIGITCEFISGVVEFTFMNIWHLIVGICKSIKALFTGDWDEIDNIWSETFAKMERTTEKAWSKMKGTTTRGLAALKEASVEQVSDMSKTIDYLGKHMTKVNLDNVNVYGRTFARAMTDAKTDMLAISDDMILMLSASSDIMRDLFSGIHEGMSREDAAKKFEDNMRTILKSGKYTSEQISKDFGRAQETLSKHAATGSKKIQKYAEEVYDVLGRTNRTTYEKMSDLFQKVQKMDAGVFESFKKTGGAWAELFDGISKDGVASTEEMVQKLVQNYLKLQEKHGDLAQTLKGQLSEVFNEETGLIKDELLGLKDTIDGVGGEIHESVTKIFDTFGLEGAKSVQDISKQLAELVSNMTSEQKKLLVENDPSGYWYSLMHGLIDTTDMSQKEISDIITGNVNFVMKKNGDSFEQYKEKLIKGYNQTGLITVEHYKNLKKETSDLLGTMILESGQKTDEVAKKMEGAIKNLSTGNKEILMETSETWKTLLTGLEDTSKMSSEDIVKKIVENLSKLKIETPEQMAEFVKILTKDLSQAEKIADEKTKAAAEAAKKNTEEASKNAVVDPNTEQTAANLDENNKVIDEKTKAGADAAKKNSDEASKNSEVKPNTEKTAQNLDEANRIIDEKTKIAEQLTADVKKVAEENLSLKDANAKADKELENVKKTYEAKTKELEQKLKTAGEDSRTAFEDELKKLSGGVEIDGNLIDVQYLETQMKGAGTLAMGAFAQGFQSASVLLPMAVRTAIPNIILEFSQPFTEFQTLLEETAKTAENVGTKISFWNQSLPTTKSFTSEIKGNINEVALLLDTAKTKSTEFKDQVVEVSKTSFGTINKEIKEIGKALGKAKEESILANAEIGKLNQISLANLGSQASDSKGKLDLLGKGATDASAKIKTLDSQQLSALMSQIDKVRHKLNGATGSITYDGQAAIKKMQTLMKLTMDALISQLNKVRHRLNGVTGSVTYDGQAAISKIKALDNVTFNNLLGRLSQLRSRLSSVSSSASAINRAVSSITLPAGISLTQPSEDSKVPTFDLSTKLGNMVDGINVKARENIQTFNSYSTSGGYFSPKSFGGTGKEAIKQVNNDNLIKTLMEQNQLLMQLVTQQRDINMSVNLDGRVVAKSTAKYMESEINNINKRKSRLGGNFGGL